MTTKKQRGFPKGTSGCVTGRPVGIRDRRHELADALGARSKELLEVAIERALAGEAPILTALLARLIPQPKPSRELVAIDGIPANATQSELADALVRAAARGELASDIAAELVNALVATARVREIDAIDLRLARLEQAAEGRHE